MCLPAGRSRPHLETLLRPIKDRGRYLQGRHHRAALLALRATNSATSRSVSAWVGGLTDRTERAGALPAVPRSADNGAAAAPSISAFGISARKRDGLPAQSRRCRTQLSCSE